MKDNKEFIDHQIEHWEKTFNSFPDMFGINQSYPAIKTVELIDKKNNVEILELGAGQGRDSIFFAKKGYNVTALDYTKIGLDIINKKAKEIKISEKINTIQHDIRNNLNLPDNMFDVCYSHMLFCMAINNLEHKNIINEIHRVLKPNGYCIYSVRHTNDPHFGKGIHRGENMYEVGGFIVNFFDIEKIKSLSNGFNIIDIYEFEEGDLPRKLFLVIMQKI